MKWSTGGRENERSSEFGCWNFDQPTCRWNTGRHDTAFEVVTLGSSFFRAGAQSFWPSTLYLRHCALTCCKKAPHLWGRASNTQALAKTQLSLTTARWRANLGPGREKTFDNYRRRQDAFRCDAHCLWFLQDALPLSLTTSPRLQQLPKPRVSDLSFEAPTNRHHHVIVSRFRHSRRPR